MLVIKWRPRPKRNRWTFNNLPSSHIVEKEVLKGYKKIALKIKSSAKEIKTRENKKNIQITQAHIHTQNNQKKKKKKELAQNICRYNLVV